MKRRSNTFGGDAGFDIRTPVESRRQEQGGVVIDVVVPLLQSFVVAIIAASVLIAFLNLVFDAGELPFWVGSGTVALASFLWVLWARDTDPLSLVSAVLMALLAGFFCWALARVATWAKRDWLRMWTLAAFSFLLTFWLHIELTLLQRLAQPWQFQRQSLWGTFRTLAEFWGKKTRPREPVLRPIANTGTRPVVSEPMPYDAPVRLTEIEMFLELARDYETLARDDSKTSAGLRGKMKSDGRPLTKTEWEEGIAWLIEYDYVERANGGTRWMTGAGAEVALSQFVR